MKLAKPIKFRRGIKNLIDFIDYENGIDDSNSDRDNWLLEVDAVRSEIDPKDWAHFDKLVERLRLLGEDLAKAWQVFEMELDFCNQGMEKILAQTKPRRK